VAVGGRRRVRSGRGLRRRLYDAADTATHIRPGEPATRTRVDLALRLDGVEPGGRLLDGRNTAGGGLNLRVALRSVDDLDDEAVELLRRAYDANL
jgi:hypothetical protein